ncbi:MAG: hypothetical protein AB1531_03940 [Chloroflexota bacterium]
MDNRSNQLVIREYPIFEWFFGLLMFGIGLFAYQNKPDQLTVPIIVGVIGLFIFLLSAILTVKADRSTGLLTIQRAGLFRRFKREIPLSEILTIQLEHSISHGSSSRRSTSVYRIVVITKSQEVIPFRNSYSSGQRAKEAKAKKLREFLGVGGADGSLVGIFQEASGKAVDQFKQEQEAITGSQETENVTDGVHWKLETRAMGGTPVSRWFSPDFRWDDNFVYLTQKMQTQGSQSGLMSLMGKMLFKTSLSLYGFPADLTPGLENADVLAPLDNQLEPYFMAFSSDPAGARQILNPWVGVPLGTWAEKYPLKQGNTNQMAVLFSPQGVYLAMMGLVNPGLLEELTALGVVLVKAQGSK